jgi:hypothetical protein
MISVEGGEFYEIQRYELDVSINESRWNNIKQVEREEEGEITSYIWISGLLPCCAEHFYSGDGSESAELNKNHSMFNSCKNEKYCEPFHHLRLRILYSTLKTELNKYL